MNTNQIEQYLNNFIPEYKDCAGLFLCLSGETNFMINNHVFHIERGTLYIISPLVIIYKVSQTHDFDGFHIIDRLEVFYPIVHSIIDTIIHLKLRNNPCLILSSDEINLLIDRKRIIDKKNDELKANRSVEENIIVQKMIHLLEQEAMLEAIQIYFRNKMVEPHCESKRETIVYNFIYSLHMNYKENRSVAFYANEAHLSVGYFTAVVKNKTNHSPSEWIIAITLLQAKILLQKTKKSIKEISADLNFPEQFTFRKYFKQHTGIPPKEYRLRCSRLDSDQ